MVGKSWRTKLLSISLDDKSIPVGVVGYLFTCLFFPLSTFPPFVDQVQFCPRLVSQEPTVGNAFVMKPKEQNWKSGRGILDGNKWLRTSQSGWHPRINEYKRQTLAVSTSRNLPLLGSESVNFLAVFCHRWSGLAWTTGSAPFCKTS
jgi:hypothetical protein